MTLVYRQISTPLYNDLKVLCQLIHLYSILCGLYFIDPIQMCEYILILVNVPLNVFLEVLDSLVVVLAVPSPVDPARPARPPAPS